MKRCACTARAAAAHALVGDGGAQADVAGDGAAEQVHVLQHEGERGAQLRQVELADVDAVQRDPARRHVVEARQQADEVVLPAPVAPTRATLRPGSTAKLTSRSTQSSSW